MRSTFGRPFAQASRARLSCQRHQSTTPIPSAAIKTKTIIRAEASIHAAAGTQNAMMIPRRHLPRKHMNTCGKGAERQ